ncbi:HEXIM protein, partial [Atractosteus spatula]|nr:HEXIM protein [Atractosteus spatula]
MSEPADPDSQRGPQSPGAPAGGSPAPPGQLAASEGGGAEAGARGRCGAGGPAQNGAAEEPGQARGSPEACPGEGGPAAQGRSGGALNPGCPGGGLPAIPEARLGKKKHRRRPSKKKRRWKPYFKLSWEEKKELDERETARASRVRAEMFAKGLPVAPYNTTQFLMDEHDLGEPDLNTELCGRRLGAAGRPEDTASEEDFPEPEDEEEGSGGGSDGMGRPGDGGGEFLQRDFSETYERYHVESLQNMTKQELVREYLELEKCMSRLEDENNLLRLRAKALDVPAESPAPEPAPAPADPQLQQLQELQSELERLRAQNSELRLQNERWSRERGPGASPGE